MFPNCKLLSREGLYNFFSFIYVGEVVWTSEVAKAVLGVTLGYPWGWLPAVVEPLRMTMAHDVRACLVCFGSVCMGTSGGIGVVSVLWAADFGQWVWDAVGIRDNFSSGRIWGETPSVLVMNVCLVFARLYNGYSSISSCDAWPP